MIDRLRRVLTPVIVLAALIGVGLVVREAGPDAARAFAGTDVIPLLAAAVATNVAGLMCAVQSWRVLVPGDHGIRGLNAAKIFFLGQLSKYVPGRVWGVVTHIAHGREAGVPAAQMTSAYLLSLALTVLTGTGVGLLAAPAALPGHWLWLCLPALGFLACAVWPVLATRPIAAVARLVRRPVEPPPDRAVRLAILFAVAAWLASGVHLWLLVLALGAPVWSGLASAIGAFALATVVSSLAVIVPDGWGVRELTITAALATVLPAGLAATAALASRLVCVLAELGSSAVVLAWSRIRSARSARSAPHTPHAPQPPHSSHATHSTSSTPRGEARVHP